MKKQLLLSFLAGLVMPLVLAAAFQKSPPVPDVESDALSPTRAAEPGDEAVELTVKNRSGNLQQMTLEDYLVGVVLAEMPADFESEALKAQAVVARTYTRRRMAGGKHTDAAVCMDPGCCQGFRSEEDYLREGGRQPSVDKVRAAVADTDGLVLEYGGSLIDATYFSCSGGVTEDAVAVWGRDVPYLQSVQSPGEESAPRFRDSVSFSAAEFAEKLGLRSTAFEVAVSGKTITITTRGFGHRVGMSQYGAQAMAKAGSSCAEILAHYYTGAELVSHPAAYYGN